MHPASAIFIHQEEKREREMLVPNIWCPFQLVLSLLTGTLICQFTQRNCQQNCLRSRKFIIVVLLFVINPIFSLVICFHKISKVKWHHSLLKQYEEKGLPIEIWLMLPPSQNSCQICIHSSYSKCNNYYRTEVIFTEMLNNVDLTCKFKKKYF